MTWTLTYVIINFFPNFTIYFYSVAVFKFTPFAARVLPTTVGVLVTQEANFLTLTQTITFFEFLSTMDRTKLEKALNLNYKLCKSKIIYYRVSIDPFNFYRLKKGQIRDTIQLRFLLRSLDLLAMVVSCLCMITSFIDMSIFSQLSSVKSQDMTTLKVEHMIFNYSLKIKIYNKLFLALSTVFLWISAGAFDDDYGNDDDSDPENDPGSNSESDPENDPGSNSESDLESDTDSDLSTEPYTLQDEAIVSFWIGIHILVCLGAFLQSNFIITNEYCANKLTPPLNKYKILLACERKKINPSNAVKAKHRISENSLHWIIEVSST